MPTVNGGHDRDRLGPLSCVPLSSAPLGEYQSRADPVRTAMNPARLSQVSGRSVRNSARARTAAIRMSPIMIISTWSISLTVIHLGSENTPRPALPRQKMAPTTRQVSGVSSHGQMGMTWVGGWPPPAAARPQWGAWPRDCWPPRRRGPGTVRRSRGRPTARTQRGCG